MIPKSMLTLLIAITIVSCSLESRNSNSVSFVATSSTKLRILAILGHAGKSHFDFFKPLLEELAQRGHELTVISSFPRNESLRNYKDIDIRSASSRNPINLVNVKNLDLSWFRMLSNVQRLRSHGIENCRNTYENSQVRQLIESNAKFDLIMTEAFNTDCYMGFVHRFQAPFILLSSHQIMPWTARSLDDPHNPSYVPHLFTRYSRIMNFFERLTNTLSLLFIQRYYEYAYNGDAQAVAEKAIGTMPNVGDIITNASGILLNVHHSLHGSAPHNPNVVEVGGLHIPSKIKPLPLDIKRFLDNAGYGVVYFNFGSMVKAASLPTEKLEAILNAIKSISPVKVIWKWEMDELPNKPVNLMVKKWLPQFDLLSKLLDGQMEGEE